MTGAVVTERAAILAALDDPARVPPTIAGEGAALELRAAMARFSGPAEHATRRAAVVAAIAGVDVQLLAGTAAARTRARLTGGPVDALVEIAQVVPTQALAACLDAPDASVADVDAVVAVIGRGQPATPSADRAAERLVDRFGVAGASLLYQNFDATAALIATRLAGRATGIEPAPAVPRTKRVGADGIEVTLEIGVAGLPFGAGPHQCPGEQLAEVITGAVLVAIESAGYRPDPGSIEVDPDGRPTALTLTPERLTGTVRRRPPGTPGAQHAEIATVRFIEFDAKADADELTAFLADNEFPFHRRPRLTEQEAREAVDGGRFWSADSVGFWVGSDRQRIGIAVVDDLGDIATGGSPVFDLRLAEAHRGRGLGALVLRGLTDLVFARWPDTMRFEGQTREDNLAMRATFRKVGWVKEAYYRRAWPVDGEPPKASVAYAALRSDWEGGTATPVVWDDL